MLYPPIVEYAAPAFNFENPVRIYFAISTYNSKEEIAQAQVTVRYQINNANALDTNKYPNKIKCCGIEEVLPQDDPIIASTAARFFIEIDPSDIITGNFNTDLIYKVQIRFSNKTLPSTASINQLAANASEWSTVCLIKPIEEPEFQIVELQTQDDTQSSQDITITTILSTLEPDFTGVYIPKTITETLKYWRMKLYDTTGTQLLADTKPQTVNTFDADSGRVAFDAHLEYVMTNNVSYFLTFQIQTKNGYTSKKDYRFTAMSYASGAIDAQLDLTIDEQDGYAKVKLTGNGTIVHTNVTLRRTSSKTNFTVWEDIANKTFENSVMDWTYYDFTIESGVFYQYGAQTRDNRGRRSSMIRTSQEMGEWDDAFLTERSESLENAIQLKIRYDMNISNSMVNVGEAKTDTIGSKYPFVRRNGDMYYHTFPFSFLITAYTDNNHIFATEKEIRDGQEDFYAVAHNSYPLGPYFGQYDYTYERDFREKVQAFLYNNKVKLFRSLTEGNFLIKLMNITLTPKQELGRLLYSVDATAVEIDEATVAKFDYYGIQSIGTFNPNITFDQAKIGQLNLIELEWRDENNLVGIENYYPANFNLMGDDNASGQDSLLTIRDLYGLGKVSNGVLVADLYLSYLRIEIDSDPYLIKNVDGVLTPFDDIDPTTDKVDENTLLGTLVNINGTTILIEYPNRIYEMKGDKVHIDSTWNITPLKDTQMIVDFTVCLSQVNDTSRIASTLIYSPVNGQLAEVFTPRASLQNKIWYKYYLDYYGSKEIKKPYYLHVNTIYTMNIEAEPGAIIYAYSNSQEAPQRLVLDETGELFLDPGAENGYIADAWFYGKNIETRKLRILETQPDKPFQLDAYMLDQEMYIFYNGKWYLGMPQENGQSYDIECPIDGLVNYYIQLEKGIY